MWYDEDMRSDWVNLEGKRYGHLTVVKYIGFLQKENYRASMYLVRCDCGKEIEMRTQAFHTGINTTCGCRSWGRRDRGDTSFELCYNEYKKRSKKLGRCFEITKEDFRILTKQNCYYCGTEPQGEFNANSCAVKTLKCPYPTYIYNGLDRIDSSKGYTLDNVVSCCKTCNWMKSDMSQQEFIDQCNRISLKHK